MEHRGPMVGHKFAFALVMSFAGAGTLFACTIQASGQRSVPGSSQNSSTSSSDAQGGQGASSSQKGQHKTAHHVTVAEEVAPPPELGKAEEYIQKQQYSDAE